MNLEPMLALGKGLYAWATPDQQSVLKLQMFEALWPNLMDYEGSSDFHCTLVYCKDAGAAVPEAVEAVVDAGVPTSNCAATPAVWIDHKGRGLAVMLLDNPDLSAVNSRLVAAGVPHSYSPFSAHITLGKIEGDHAKVEAFLQDVWGDQTINLDPQLKYALCL